jgi:diamine N-acetyltransferase
LEGLKIGFAETIDVPKLLEIKKQSHTCFVRCRPDIYKDSEILYTEDFLMDFFQNERKYIIIARIQGDIVGFAFVEKINVILPMMVNREYVYVHDMAVLEGFRHQGIATKLLEYIENYALNVGATKIELAVHLFSDNAISLYQKSGFSARTIRMEKEL